MSPMSLATESRREVSEDDIYGMTRYLAAAVVDGEISEEEASAALGEFAEHDGRLLERAATHQAPQSETERLLHLAALREDVAA